MGNVERRGAQTSHIELPLPAQIGMTHRLRRCGDMCAEGFTQGPNKAAPRLTSADFTAIEQEVTGLRQRPANLRQTRGIAFKVGGAEHRVAEVQRPRAAVRNDMDRTQPESAGKHVRHLQHTVLLRIQEEPFHPIVQTGGQGVDVGNAGVDEYDVGGHGVVLWWWVKEVLPVIGMGGGQISSYP